jgi:hypothetical protein
MSDDTPGSRLDLDWSKTLAGALAAMSSAVLLSTLGAAGTLIGAAVGSVAATVGTALYAQGLVKSKERVAQAQETALNKVGAAQAEVRRARRRGTSGATAEGHLEQAEEQLAEAEAELGDALDGGRDHGDDPVLDGFPDDEVRPGWRARLAVLPWKRIALGAAATFVVALLAIAAFELISGRSVSSYTGGSDPHSRSTFTGGGDDDKQKKGRDQQSPKPDPSDSTTPSDEASDDASDEASDEPSTELTETPSETPSEEPSETPSEESSETDAPTPTPTPLPTLPTTPAG